MASLGIEPDQGRFRYGGFSYDRLVDAMDYALLLVSCLVNTSKKFRMD